MTEREIERILAARGVPEFVRSIFVPELLGVPAASVKAALDQGKLEREARGTVSRAGLAVWLKGRADLLAMMLQRHESPGTDCGGLYVPGWRDETFTVRNMRYEIGNMK